MNTVKRILVVWLLLSLLTGATWAWAFGDIANAQAPRENSDVEQWHDTAMAVGWTEAQWPWLRCVIQRESHGNPGEHNGTDPGYGSFGLMQVNMSKGKHGTWAVYGALLGFDITYMYDPQVNLAVALDLYHRAQRAYGRGTVPWGRGCRR